MKDLDLFLQGKPFTLEDHGVGREWIIHPFSWFLKTPNLDFEIDWEHSEWQWLSPKDVLDNKFEGDSVPNLSESLWRVWLGDGGMFGSDRARRPGDSSAGEKLRRCLKQLQEDHESGARVMASNALRHLHEVMAATENEPSSGTRTDPWRQTRMVAWHLINNGRESMNAAIATTLLQCLKTLVPVKDDRAGLLAGIQKYSEQRKASSAAIGKSFAAFLNRQSRTGTLSGEERQTVSLVTLSSSSTFVNALLHSLQSCDVTFDVRILESRPLCEGASLATKLLEGARQIDRADRLKVTLATDASAAVLAKGVDFVILGADRIFESGDVSNKTGSFPAVLSARAVAQKSGQDVKVIVLSEIEKVSKRGSAEEHKDEVGQPEDLTRGWDLVGVKDVTYLTQHDSVHVKNITFETVPAEYIDAYITENGEMGQQHIREQSHFVQELECELFDDL